MPAYFDLDLRKLLVCSGLAALLLSSVAIDPVLAEDEADDDYMEAEPGVLLEPIDPIPGARPVVAVGRCDSQGAFSAAYGDWPVGAGLSAMTVTALHESDQFVIAERAQLQQTLAEQELAAGGLTKQEGRPELGQLYNVQFFIYCAVTEFSTKDKGGGFSLGVSSGPFGGGASQQSNVGVVGLDYRIVDTTDGSIVDSFSVKEKVKSSSWNVSGGYKQINMGTNQFYSTPLGEAARKTITKAVRKIAKKLSNVDWTSLVVEFDGYELYLNAGSNARLGVGDRFRVERIVKRFTDPATGETLSVRKKELGTVTLTGVEDRLSWGTFTPAGQEPPQRGDMVVRLGN